MKNIYGDEYIKVTLPNHRHVLLGVSPYNVSKYSEFGGCIDEARDENRLRWMLATLRKHGVGIQWNVHIMRTEDGKHFRLLGYERNGAWKGYSSYCAGILCAAARHRRRKKKRRKVTA